MNQSLDHALGFADHAVILCFAFVVYGVVSDTGVGPLSELVDVADVGGRLLEYYIPLGEEVTWKKKGKRREREEKGLAKTEKGMDGWGWARGGGTQVVATYDTFQAP